MKDPKPRLIETKDMINSINLNKIINLKFFDSNSKAISVQQ